MSKPAGFHLTVIVLWVFVVAGVVVALIPMTGTPPGMAIQGMEFAARFQVVGAIIGALIAAPFVYFYSQGQNWARWVIMVVSVFYLIGGIVGIRMLSLAPAKAVLGILEAIFAVYLLYYLNTAPVKAWFERAPVVAA